MPRLHRLAVAAALLFTSAALAQPRERPGAAEREKMKQLAPLLGEYQGEGWIDLGPQMGRKTFHSHESFQSKLEGTVVLVEGLGTSQLSPGGPQVPTHQALGFLSYDANTGRFQFVSYRVGGERMDSEFKVNGAGDYQWGFPAGPAQIRFTIHASGGHFVERGERSIDGTHWIQFFQMDLART